MIHTNMLQRLSTVPNKSSILQNACINITKKFKHKLSVFIKTKFNNL